MALLICDKTCVVQLVRHEWSVESQTRKDVIEVVDLYQEQIFRRFIKEKDPYKGQQKVENSGTSDLYQLRLHPTGIIRIQSQIVE